MARNYVVSSPGNRVVSSPGNPVYTSGSPDAVATRAAFAIEQDSYCESPCRGFVSSPCLARDNFTVDPPTGLPAIFSMWIPQVSGSHRFYSRTDDPFGTFVSDVIGGRSSSAYECGKTTVTGTRIIRRRYVLEIVSNPLDPITGIDFTAVQSAKLTMRGHLVSFLPIGESFNIRVYWYNVFTYGRGNISKLPYTTGIVPANLLVEFPHTGLGGVGVDFVVDLDANWFRAVYVPGNGMAFVVVTDTEFDQTGLSTYAGFDPSGGVQGSAVVYGILQLT